ncbi:oxidoreductase [Pediococcus siamensis]|uniref:oxidoreductase n=1 Tax=Pediococcus siamensis TaxID=381829 RepID=UPI0039A2828A
MKAILITGASSGIGYQTAALLAKQGNKVYGAGRRIEKIEPLQKLGVIPLSLDVTNDDSVANAVQHVIDESGRVDVLVNNAGYGSYGAIEDVSIEEAKRQYDVNVFGVARLTKAVLPYMRKQHSGRIVNVSSAGGRSTSIYGAWYHSSKYALESFSDALRMEVQPFGIDVAIIEPGAVKTNWGFIAADHLENSAQGGPYEKDATKMAKGLRKFYSSKKLSDPSIISKAIADAINKKRPKTRYLIGYSAKPLVLMHALLPTRLLDYVSKNAM